MAEEFLEGVFHFDGKVFSTAKLLLFRPGELTRRFLAGHRVPYVPPIRLYVFISFVFFLLLGTQLGHKEPKEETKPMLMAKADVLRGLKLNLGADSSDLTPGQRKRIRQSTARVAALVNDTIAATLNTALHPALKTAQGSKTKPKRDGARTSLKHIADHLPAEPTDAQVDSVLRKHGDEPDFIHRLLVRRAARWAHSSHEEVVHQVLRGISIMLFLFMPLAALLLKGAYFRQHRYYLSHLVFTIHVQSFLFIFLSLLIGLGKLHTLPDWLSGWLLLVPAAYFVVALRTFYQQSWGKTAAKSLLLGAAYSLTLLLALLTVGAVGLALF